jgi:polysaccharide export outer membrane protein
MKLTLGTLTLAMVAALATASPTLAAGPENGALPVVADYHLGLGDKLRIEVYRDAQLSQSVQIRPDGKITLPLVGDLEANGRTPIELRDLITAEGLHDEPRGDRHRGRNKSARGVRHG